MNNASKATEPIIEMTQHIFHAAQQKNASDIHLEPQDNYYRVRLRCDGLLQVLNQLSFETGLQLINRLKVLAELNLTERRLPQDGRMQYHSETPSIHYDVRINISPTIRGEKIVLRLFAKKNQDLALRNLGLLPVQLKLLKQHILKPQGLILLSGPTGSGKTLTLYSILNYLNSEERNIATVEDPIEMTLPGLNQSMVQKNLGLDFQGLLKAILRQDPDIIMIGEIRDKETAHIALQAAQTGHLVLSTIHANSTLDVLTRLTNLGLARETIGETLSLIIAQRLARKYCDHCHGIAITHSPCTHCHGGYCGRLGIFELLALDHTLKAAFLAKEKKLCAGERHLNLEQVFRYRLKKKVTSLHEFHRLFGEHNNAA